MPRCLASAATTPSAWQKPFCTRMAPSLPPHCFWCPSALCSWCSSMTPSSVRSCPSRLRGGIRFPSLPLALHAREVLVAREDALLDEQLDHRPQRGDRSPLRLFHATQDLDRALVRWCSGLRSGLSAAVAAGRLRRCRRG